MISSIRGIVSHVGLSTTTIVTATGMGLTIWATPTTLSQLRVGGETTLHTELIVREDSLTLYGFSDADERDCFTTLMGAKGVGAKLALAMLAVHTPDALRRAIASEDIAALKRVPGLGPKGAQRVIIDIGDKLGPIQGTDTSGQLSGAASFSTQARSAQAAFSSGQPHPDVVAALMNLGWSEAQAATTVSQVQDTMVAEAEREGASLPTVSDLLRMSLRSLGGARRG
ncbi:Holliday junction branch migration protein RuvA [Actinomyces vulturis]|uniref:Holliday junction branch migration protein RuvA n=1 Tax=Actinomyces vulturis TaxID=1857645 RepID=UPI000830C7AD|nr:Holliday junction branch migration protein RuvA [Actinomyces vulturis]